MAIGGFNGTDPAPTVAQSEALVWAGRIHYFVVSGAGANGGAGAGFAPASSSTTTTAGRITAWVRATSRPGPSAVLPCTT